MIREIRYSLISFSILIAALFISISVAQAAPTFPTITEIRAAYDAGLLNSTQAEILRQGTLIAAEHPEFNNTQIAEELADSMGFTSGAVAIAIYSDAFKSLEFARAIQNAPKPTISAPPLFPDSAARIQEYLRTFGASTDAAVRADIARLRLIYDPTTSGVFTPRERQIAELRILSRDPETLAVPTSEELAAWARNRYPNLTEWTRNRYPSRDIWGNPYYPTPITRAMIDTHWPRFMRHEESLPIIQAQQNAMRQLILTNTSLSPTERAFALAALTTSRDGNPPSVRSLLPLPAFNGQITRPAAYELIQQIQAQQIPPVITSPGPTLTTPVFVLPPTAVPTLPPPPTPPTLPGTGR